MISSPRFPGRAVLAALLVSGLVTAGLAAAGTAGAAPGLPWVGGWEAPVTGGGPAFDDQTVRMVVHTNAAGRELRLRLSNRYGTRPLTVGAVEVAVRADGAAVVPGTRRTVTFDGRQGTVVPRGGELAGDPVRLPVSAGEDLLVSIYLPHATGPVDVHRVAQDTSYVSTRGDHARDAGAGAFRARTGSWYVLTGLDVAHDPYAGTVVAFGDSITDGNGSTPGSNTRWPDYLARRLGAHSGAPDFSVVDAGISGNRLLTDGSGTRAALGSSALHRFRRDVLGEPGVRTVIVLEGINDIGWRIGPNGKPITARELIDGYRALIAAAHRAGVRVVGATLTPYQGAGSYTEAGERIREQVNDWILNSGAFDATVDFAGAVADPANPLRFRPAYDSGDHLHPSSAGYRAMAAAVNLAELDARTSAAQYG